MSKIKIKNFGPIREGFDTGDGFMDIKKVTVFIGDQGTGKSTVAKLISTLMWMEKAVNRGEMSTTGLNFNRFQQRCAYQGIDSYILQDTKIEYVGELYTIKITKDEPPIFEEINNGDYIVPKIMYVPAERNFLSTIKGAYDVTGLPGPLTTFAEELKRAQIDLEGRKLDLPVRKYAYEHDAEKDTAHISGTDYKIDILQASSGIQSLIPLYLVSRNIALSIAKADQNNNANISVNQLIRRNDEITRITLDDTIPDDEKKNMVSKVYARFHNKCFVNIVEEPEQNLYPTSQSQILKSLLEFNSAKGNKLVMTTHSPYIINYLTLAIKAFTLSKGIEASGKRQELSERLEKIVPLVSAVNPDDVVIYELDNNGKIIKLDSYNGLPSDENYLNEELGETNELFAQLLEIQQAL